jgi:arylsulfatase A-like enzyme
VAWTRLVPVVVALAGCGPADRATAPPPDVHLAPWRYLGDELAEGEPGRRPLAAVGDVTRYVLAELPATRLSRHADAAESVHVEGGEAELVLECPRSLAGRPVALRAARVFSGPPLDVQHSARCPEAPGAAATVRLSGLPAADTTLNASVVPVIATAEPAPRVETRWLRLPDEAVLEVAFGMANPAKADMLPPAQFEIRAEGRDGASLALLERAVDAEPGDAHRDWFSDRIPLAPVVRRLGAEVRFVFETRVAEQDRPAFPVWGDPVILVPGPRPSEERRNVLLISLDTLRADRLGCYGAIGGNTPVLDRIASEGTLFELARAAASWTAPSHATLLTGFHGCVHGLGLNGRRELPAGIAPLPEILRKVGYTTAAFTEGGYLQPAVFQRGFGRFTAPGELLEKRPWGDVDRTVDDASRWLTEHAREPFFLFVHTYQVHDPYNAPPPYGDLQRPDDGGSVASVTPEERSRNEMARYDEEVRYADSVMGRLFATVDGLGLTRRTIVIVVADHGEAFGEHGYFRHVLSLDEEVLRVPFIWRAPGLVAAGRRIPSVVGLIDVTPTVLDLLGLPLPPLVEGQSLAAFLRDVDPPLSRTAGRVVFSERMFLESAYPVVARGQSWKATFTAAGAPPAVVMLGDRRGTRSAPASVASSLAAAAYARYEDDCRRVATSLPAGTSASQPALPDVDQQERLRALGYVE